MDVSNKRQMLIERIYDAVEFPDSTAAVYSDIYYAFIHALGYKNDMIEFKTYFSEFIDPMYQRYRMEPDICHNLTLNILEKARIDIIESIANRLEYFSNMEYDTGYDSF